MSAPLRVHLVHQGFGDYVGGLLDGLASIGADRVEVVTTTITSGSATLARIGGPDHPDPDPRPDLRRHQLCVPRFRDPRSALASADQVRRILGRPADLVHWQAAGNPWVDLAMARWLRRPVRPPVVVTVHDMVPHPGDRTARPGTFAAIRRIVGRADRVIVHAGHVRDQVVAVGVDPDRVSILAHGELASRYRSADRLPLPPARRPEVLFFGRAQGYKGLDLAVGAMDRVAAAVPGARLVVAGAGPAIERVLPAGRCPTWCELRPGVVPRDEVTDLFDRAAVVVLPYREASQSGVAALAAGFGRPVVATRVPGLQDIVVDGESGLLVDPGSPAALADALIRVLSDRDLARRLGDGAHRLARTTLSWPAIASSLLSIYHEKVILGGTPHDVGEPEGRRSL